jgi:hypothetical protein
MKKFILILIMLPFLNCKQPSPACSEKDLPNYIEFVHTGITDQITNPLYIGVKRLNLKFDKCQLADLKHTLEFLHKPMPPQPEKKFFGCFYDTVITDHNSLCAVKQFILSHGEYYTNKTNLNNNVGAESYNIHIDSKITFSIYYKMKDQFINDLSRFLINGNYDKKILNELSIRHSWQ